MRIPRAFGTVLAGLLGVGGVIALIVGVLSAYTIEDPQPRSVLVRYAAGGLVALVLSTRALRWANAPLTPAHDVGARDHDLRSNDR